jgi:C1A family cysteine protease
MSSSRPQSHPLRLAVLALTATLAACSGNGASAQTGLAAGSSSLAGLAAPAPAFALGLLPADPEVIARMEQIRRPASVTPLPAAVDLSAKMPAVGDQGQESSCVAWASAYALRGYEARRDQWSSIAPKTSNPARNFSPSFVYNQTNGGRDAGSAIPAVLSLMHQKGSATLADMPYTAGQYRAQPSAAAFADAAHYKLSTYGYIAPADINSMKVQLAQGLPVILAINVYANFFNLGPNQIYSGPSGALQGGHAVALVGYDDSKAAFKVINSWGTSWGTAGYGWISYSALSKIAVEAYSAVDNHGVPKS